MKKAKPVKAWVIVAEGCHMNANDVFSSKDTARWRAADRIDNWKPSRKWRIARVEIREIK